MLDNPWTIEADIIRTVRKTSLTKAIDLVIIRYLRCGDTRALAWWLNEGHCPSPDTLKYVACMLQPGSGANTKDFPFKLTAKSRVPRRGRPKKGPEPNLRDWLIYKNVAVRMDEIGPGSYDSAIEEVASYEGLEVATVKRAYDNMSAVVSAYTSDHED
jgi:hypothetical protein